MDRRLALKLKLGLRPSTLAKSDSIYARPVARLGFFFSKLFGGFDYSRY